MQPRHFASVVLAAVLWGTGGVLGTMLAQASDVPPAAVAMWRMLIAGVVLVAWLGARRALDLRAVTPAMWRRIALTGALTALFELLYFSAIALAEVGLATLVTIGSAPMWVALWDWLRRGERPEGRRVLALLLALAGLAALLGSSLSGAGSALVGVLVALLAGASFAGVTLANREPVPALGAARLTALSFTAGGLMLVPVSALVGWGVPTGLDGWAWALALGIVATALAYVAYLSGLATVPPFVATVVTLLEPLVATVLGAWVLSERLGFVGLLGGAVLGTAVVLLRPQRDASEAVR